jgi:hypothetical protein
VSTTGIWFWGNTIHDYDTVASHSVTTANATRDGFIRLEGANNYVYNNVLRDSPNAPLIGIGMRLGRTATQPNLVYNNVIDTTTTQDPIACISGNLGGAASSYYNNTHWSLTDYDYDGSACTNTVVRNNLGVQAVANNLADSGYDTTYFTDATGGDFTLTALATGAIDAVTGDPFSSTDAVGESIQGTARDYGAFESGEATPPPPPPSGSYPTTAVIDSFTRANESPIGAPWVNGITGTGGCEITSNVLRHQAATAACYYNGASYSPTQESYVTLPNATNHGINVNFRLYGCLQDGIGTATVDGYVVRLQKVDAAADTLRIERMTNAGFVILATHSLEMSNGHKLGLQILNTGVINVWADVGSGWVQQFTATDTTHSCTATRIGVGILNANVHVDDFGGGTQVVGGGGTSNALMGIPMTYEQ